MKKQPKPSQVPLRKSLAMKGNGKNKFYNGNKGSKK